MTGLTKAILALFFAIISFNAFSRDPVPVIDHIDVPVLTSSGKPISTEQVRDSIISAAQMRNWEVARSPSQDLLTATLNVRNKHTVVVSIPYSTEKFSVKYANSINMKYSIQDKVAVSNTPYAPPTGPGVRVIHPGYNTWVQDLLRAIQFELKKL